MDGGFNEVGLLKDAAFDDDVRWQLFLERVEHFVDLPVEHQRVGVGLLLHGHHDRRAAADLRRRVLFIVLPAVVVLVASLVVTFGVCGRLSVFVRQRFTNGGIHVGFQLHPRACRRPV